MGLKVNRTGTKPHVERGTDGTRAAFRPVSLSTAASLNAAALAAKVGAEDARDDSQTYRDEAEAYRDETRTIALGDVPDASTTARGAVELTTNTEAAAGADNVRGVTAAALRYALANGQVGDDLKATIADAVPTSLSTPGSTAWLKMIGGDFGFVFTTLTTVEAATGLPTAAAIKWPDGTTGAFTGTTDGVNGYTGYVATWAAGTTKTLTASGITYDTSTGLPLGPTSLVVS